MSASGDPFDGDTFASTLLSEAAADEPTPDEEPAAAEEAAPESAEQAPARPRDASGRFASAAPAETPAADTAAPATEPAPDYAAQLAQLREENAQARRREETLRGQIANAAQQAQAAAYQRGQLEARAQQRQGIMAELDQLAASGEYDAAAIQEARQGHLARWQAEDTQARAAEEQHRANNMEVGGVALHIDHATVNLHQRGIPSLAQQSGLPEEYAREFFDQEETKRYQRAIGQAKMAEVAAQRGIPASGFNAAADRDYLETVFQGMHLAGRVYRALSERHAAREAELQQQIDQLQIELNRDKAPTVPFETAARGAGRTRRTADEHAAHVLREHAGDLAALLRTG